MFKTAGQEELQPHHGKAHEPQADRKLPPEPTPGWNRTDQQDEKGGDNDDKINANPECSVKKRSHEAVPPIN